VESKGLRVGELARRTGLTVRTLHHWEAVGLLVPEGRTPSGHRLYGGEAVQRLQSIRSLKALGLGLEEIRTVLSSGAASLEDAIRAQHQHVKEQLRKLEALEERLQKTLSFLRDGGEAPQEELMRNMEMMTAIQVHFSSKELAFLRTRGDSLEAETIREAQEEWPELIQSMKAEMAKGTDPSNAVVKKLASRWRGLVQAFSGGNERVEGSLSSMYRSEPGLAEGQGLSEELFQYVARALSELKHDAQDGAA
jgi:DNA-binding transcriptional MerR regulator